MAFPRSAACRRTLKSRMPKFDPYKLPHERAASGIAAPSGGETGTGSTEGKSPVGNAETPQ